jgi:hypothetical protein
MSSSPTIRASAKLGRQSPQMTRTPICAGVSRIDDSLPSRGSLEGEFESGFRVTDPGKLNKQKNRATRRRLNFLSPASGARKPDCSGFSSGSWRASDCNNPAHLPRRLNELRPQKRYMPPQLGAAPGSACLPTAIGVTRIASGCRTPPTLQSCSLHAESQPRSFREPDCRNRNDRGQSGRCRGGCAEPRCPST